jgi:hypothetical protein
VKKTPLPDWIGPLVDLAKGLKNEFLIFAALVVLVLVLLGLFQPQVLDQLWPLFVFFGVLALVAFLAALFAPALSERIKPRPPVEMPRGREVPQERPLEGPPCPPTLTPEQQRLCYLDTLIADHRRMRLTGLDPNASDPRRGGMTLEHLYVSLDTETFIRQERDEEERAQPVPSTQERERPLSALEALVNADNGRMVLLGMPGAGKSTFVRYVALNLAQALRDVDFPLTEHLPDWQGEPIIPVVISLGWLAEGLDPDVERGTAKMVEDFLSSTFGTDERLQNYDTQLLTELRERGGLVCFDGLDEVANLELRPIVRQAIEAFARRYGQHPRTRFLVTCRTFSYTDERWQLTAWEQHRLAPLTPEKVHHFVDAWYTELSRIDPGHQSENERKRQRLHAALQPGDPRRLLEIADTPLILTVMAVVHGHRELPDSRAQVYERCVDLLVNRWELERTPQEADVRRRACWKRCRLRPSSSSRHFRNLRIALTKVKPPT